MSIEKIKEKARIYMYYQGLFGRLRDIAADIAKINAQDALYNKKWKDSKVESLSEEDVSEALFRSIYKSELEKEAAEIRKITETPVIKHAAP